MRYQGIDVLRGLGVFMLLILHSAFSNFDGLYALDLNQFVTGTKLERLNG